jgi:hypothetical protein
LKRIAKADAEAALIKAQSEIQITDLHRRAMRRFISEEAVRQQNMEQITEKAVPLLSDGAKPESMSDGWISNFFDKARIVSDGEMQMLWAAVLAGEASGPGRFSRRTVNRLADVDKQDAELFQTLCRFGWLLGGVFTPLVFNVEAAIYVNNGLNFGNLTHLESIDLIQFSNLSNYSRTGFPRTFNARYCGKPLTLTMPNEGENTLGIGLVLLTQVGQELATVCKVPGVPGFREYVMERWKQYSPIDGFRA